MSVSFDPRKSATAFDHDSTLVTVLELSGKTWLLGAIAPGVSRRPRKSIEARDLSAVSAGSGCLNSFPRMISGVPPGFVMTAAFIRFLLFFLDAPRWKTIGPFCEAPLV